MTVTRGSVSVLAGMLEGNKSDDEVDFAAATGEIAQFHFRSISPHLLQALYLPASDARGSLRLAWRFLSSGS